MALPKHRREASGRLPDDGKVMDHPDLKKLVVLKVFSVATCVTLY